MTSLSDLVRGALPSSVTAPRAAARLRLIIRLHRALLLLGLAWLAAASAPPAPPPNVLLILADDMGFGDCGLAGNPVLNTPNLDRLAREGVRFQNFYVSPVCAPTRASLLTGRYAQRTGVRSVTNGFETMAPDETTAAEIFSKNGYRTGLFGKWHLGENHPSLPNAQGFGEFVGFRTGHFDDYFDPTLERNGRPYPTKGYITDVLTDEAMRFMDQGRRTRRPFFCYLPFNAPHTPLEVEERFFRKFLEKGIPEATARVYGMVENLDANVGRLLDFLEKNKLARNTLVIFLSDNGPIWRGTESRFNAGLRDKKFTVFEGGIRTQCFWRWSGRLPEGETVETVAAHVDVLPTLLDFCGLKPKADADGRSLRPLLETPKAPWPERTLFLNYSLKTLHQPAPYPGGVARTARFKLVDGTDLYDLQTDPGETTNVATQHPDLVRDLDAAYRAWWQETHARRGFAPLPVPVGHAGANPVMMTPHLGRARGGVKFFGKRGTVNGKPIVGQHPEGVDGDWASAWKTPEDQVSWNLDVVRAGTYEIALTLRGKAASRWRVTVGEATAEASAVGLQPERWTAVSVGRLRLPAGPQTLTVRAPGADGSGGLELKNVVMKKVN